MRFFRFPGGTYANEYHWNGNGRYDADQVWRVDGSPRVTTFASGFYDSSVHRGSTFPVYGLVAKVTDGKPDTCWMSYPGDENPQWIYLDIRDADGQGVPVSRAVIDWGVPYAVQFKIQYSNAKPLFLGAYCYNDTAWSDASSGTLAGKGGRSDVGFETVTAKYVRVRCLVSSNALNQYAISEIRLYSGGTQITRNQNDGLQTPAVSSSVALGDTFQEPNTMDFEQFMSFAQSVAPDAVPLVQVNAFTGTPQEAADWVYYSNVQKGYKVRRWEVGNESWGTWEIGGPIDSARYAKRFIEFYDAMTAVDPGIMIIPSFLGVMDVENATMDGRSNSAAACEYYIDNFLRYLHDHGRPDIVRAVSIHGYPTVMPKSEAAVLENVDQWDGQLPQLKQWIGRRCQNPAGIGIYLTEYNDGIDSGFTNHFYNALFVSGFLLDFLKNGGDASCIYAPFGTPGPGGFDKTISADMGMLEAGGFAPADLGKRYQPRASFYALDILYNHFSAEDARGNALVSAISSGRSLKAYANRRGDGKLSLILINIDPDNAAIASVALDGFAPAPSAERVSYSPREYSWATRAGKSYADPDDPPRVGAIDHAGPVFSTEVEPYSIQVITLRGATP